jgi:bifunctional non-homologous end joining protein LigD
MGNVPLPRFVEPQLATLVDEVPRGESWIHEIKLDGYRMQLRVDGRSVNMLSRNGKDWIARVPALVEQARQLDARRVLLDGELVHMDENGRTSFSSLVEELGKGARADVVYQAFDLLHIDGEDWTGKPLLLRKERLGQLLQYAKTIAIRYSDHVEGPGEEMYQTACRHELEGIISKLADGPYRSGRSRDWVKVKCVTRQELVLCGYTPSTKSHDQIGSLILGVHDRDGVLRYAGRVGTGFTEKQRRELKRMLEARKLAQSPFGGRLRERGLSAARWAAPELVGEVAFTEWTEDGRLRHPSFQGLREDKEARDVVVERARRLAQGTDTRADNGKPGARLRSARPPARQVSEPPGNTRRTRRRSHSETRLTPDTED